MKRQRSYSDDLMEGDGSGNSKEWGRREQEGTKMRSLKGLDSTATTCYKKSYSSRGFNYDKDEARGSSRKRMEIETEGFERPRDGYARVSSRRDSNPRRTEVPRSSRESGGGGYRDGGDSAKGRLERGRRSSSFSAGSASKRESYENLKFGAKGFRSERERPKRDDLRSYGIEGSGSLWKRTSEDYYHRRGNGTGTGTGNETSGEDRSNGWSHGIGLAKSPQGSKETVDSFKESRKGERAISQSNSNSNSTSEMEEGELEPELEPEPESRVWQHQEHEQEQQTGQLKPETETEGEGEGEGEAEAEAEAETEAGVEQQHEELSSKGIQEEHGDLSAAEADEGMATQMDDSKHADGKVDVRDALFGNGSRDGDREEVGKGEELKPVLDLDKTNEDEEKNDLEIAPRLDICADSVAKDPDSAGKNVTVNEVVQELSEKEIEQQPAAGWRIEERKGVDLEVEVKMETMEDASDEIERAEEKSKCKELTFSFMCDAPKAPGDVQDKTDAGSRGDPMLKSMKSLVPQEGEEMGKDKDQRLSLSLSNGPGVYGKWDERALLLSSERKKKAPLEEELGVGGSSSRFQREPQSSTKIEEGRSELSNEKLRQKKAKLEPLQLSLGLPDVSLTLASPSINVAPASPSRGRSYQSLSHTAHTIHTAHTQTGSDAFTTSISFSGSHPFVHNPSCSLTQNSMDNYEFSVGSHPAFQSNSDQVSPGNWNATYPNEQTSYDNNGLIGVASQDVLKQRREAHLYQRISQNGNLQAPQFSQGMFGGNSRGQPSKDRDPTAYERGATDTNFQGNFAMTQGQHGRSSEGSLGKSNSVERHAKFLMAQGKQARSSDGNLGRLNGPEKHTIFPRELPEQWREVKSSPTQSVGSREKGSDQWKQIIRDSSKSDRERASMSQRGYNGRGIEHSIPGAVPSIERILFDIVSEPIPVMCQRLKEMPAKALDHLRECSGELIGKNEKAEEFFTFQKILQNRTDLTSEVLLQAHKVQLEILVAVKTGIKGFILNNNLQSSELVEVFLQVRCRNIACRSALPVDDCECKICSQRNGFCSACMCLVCSKFDFANNTCSWIGCDVCLHWCHTDCGIRMSYVRNGPSVNGAPGTTEMQFHCIGCEHASEMFGFVKEVFRTCFEGWDVETLAKELDCVRRIFQRSEDPRGKQLWNKAGQMLAKLESKADPAEVCNSFMLFLSECDTKVTGTSCVTAKDPVQSKQTAVREAVYNIPSGSGEKVGTSGTSERARTGLQNYDREAEGKRTEATEMQYNRTRNKAEIDELESIVRIKQAEAKMFQVRADDARREAEGLQRIAIAKNEKIEEEYACKLAKLCLAEVEERRKNKLEELQIIEKDQREYYNMKIRMEADIKDLLMKMEAAKRRF